MARLSLISTPNWCNYEPDHAPMNCGSVMPGMVVLFREILDKGIKAIVQLAMEEPPLQPPRELVYLRFPLLDGTGNDPNMLHLAISCVATLIRQGTPTLVCCGGGMSRSPAVVAAALSTVEDARCGSVPGAGDPVASSRCVAGAVAGCSSCRGT